MPYRLFLRLCVRLSPIYRVAKHNCESDYPILFSFSPPQPQPLLPRFSTYRCQRHLLRAATLSVKSLLVSSIVIQLIYNFQIMKSTKEVIPPCRYRNKGTKQNRKAGKTRAFHINSMREASSLMKMNSKNVNAQREEPP